MKQINKISLSVAMFALISTFSSADTLEQVKKKGYVSCGISSGVPGFYPPY